MGKKRKSGFDPFEHVMEQGGMHVGIMGVNTLVNRMPGNPSKGVIQSNMRHMNVLPMMHNVGGVFSSLKDLEKKSKRRR